MANVEFSTFEESSFANLTSNSGVWVFDRTRNNLITNIAEPANARRLRLRLTSDRHPFCMGNEETILIHGDTIYLVEQNHVQIITPGRFNWPFRYSLRNLTRELRSKFGIIVNENKVYLFSDGCVYKANQSGPRPMVDLGEDIDSFCVLEDSDARFRCAFVSRRSGGLFSAIAIEDSEEEYDRSAGLFFDSRPHIIGHHQAKIYLSFNQGSLIAAVDGRNRHRIVFELTTDQNKYPSVVMHQNKIYVRGRNTINILNVETRRLIQLDILDLFFDIHPETYLIRQYDIQTERPEGRERLARP